MATPAQEINEKLLRRLDSIYAEAETKLISSVARRVKRGITEEGYNEKKLADVQRMRVENQRLLADTNAIAKSSVSKGLVKSYIAGRNEVKSPGIPDSMLPRDVPNRLQRHIMESENLIDGTSFQVLRNTDDAYREVMAKSQEGLLAGVDAQRAVAQKALNSFAARGITGFVDKVGRKWQLQSYVDMAARTGVAQAARQGHLDRMTELGRDLMQISTVNATCPICAPWSNRIISISGADKRYPSLDDAKTAGVFHPNCNHTILDYDEEDAELDSILGIDPSTKTGYDALPKNNDVMYKATQTQRGNENMMRKWKRYEAAAITPEQARTAHAKVKFYQDRNAKHIEAFGLKRSPQREGILKAQKAAGGSGTAEAGTGTAKAKEVPKKAPEKPKPVPPPAPVPVSATGPRPAPSPMPTKGTKGYQQYQKDFKAGKIYEEVVDAEGRACRREMHQFSDGTSGPGPKYNQPAYVYESKNGVKLSYDEKTWKSLQEYKKLAPDVYKRYGFTPDKALSALESLPKELSKYTNNMEFVSYRNPRDAFWAKQYNIPGARSTACGGNRQMTFFEPFAHDATAERMRGTLFHEAAHCWDQEGYIVNGTPYKFSSTPAYDNILKADRKYINPDNPVVGAKSPEWSSRYATTSKSQAEDFAEVLRQVYTGREDDREAFTLAFPNRTKYVKGVFGDA